MVQVVVLILSLLFVACAPLPTSTAVDEPLIAWQPLEHLDEGQHSPAVASLLAQAEKHRQNYQLQMAAGLLDQARQIEPRNPEIFYRQAWLELKRNQPAQAESLLRRGLVFCSPSSVQEQRLQLLLAESLDQQGRVLEAGVIRQKVNATP